MIDHFSLSIPPCSIVIRRQPALSHEEVVDRCLIKSVLGLLFQSSGYHVPGCHGGYPFT